AQRSRGDFRRLLCLMGVLGPSVHLELLALLLAEGVLRQHASHRLLDHLDRSTLAQVTRRLGLEAARASALTVVDLLLFLATGEDTLVDIDDDLEVTGVDVRRERPFLLAQQNTRHDDEKPTERVTGGFDDVPLPLDLDKLGAVIPRHD